MPDDFKNYIGFCRYYNLKPNRGASVIKYKNRYLLRYPEEIQKRIIYINKNFKQ